MSGLVLVNYRSNESLVMFFVLKLCDQTTLLIDLQKTDLHL